MSEVPRELPTRADSEFALEEAQNALRAAEFDVAEAVRQLETAEKVLAHQRKRLAAARVTVYGVEGQCRMAREMESILANREAKLEARKLRRKASVRADLSA